MISYLYLDCVFIFLFSKIIVVCHNMQLGFLVRTVITKLLKEHSLGPFMGPS